MDNDGPVFTYSKAEKDKTDEAIRSAAKEHVWEHKQPVSASSAPIFSEAETAAYLTLKNESIKRAAMAAISRTEAREYAKSRSAGQIGGLEAQLAQARTFTREEVLTVLKSQAAAIHPALLGRPAVMEYLETLVRIFERME
jgi:hypothetical protein